MIRLFFLFVVFAAAQIDALPREAYDVMPDLTTNESKDLSPRTSIRLYIDLCRKQEFDAAGFFLIGATKENRAALAGKFKKFLDRRLWIDLEGLSASPAGNLDDGLGPDQEILARIDTGEGRSEKIYLERVRSGSGRYWGFSRRSTVRISVWYDSLGASWLLNIIPDPFQAKGPFEIEFWQWVAIPLLFFLCLLAGFVLSWASTKFLGAIAARNNLTWDDDLVKVQRKPLVFLESHQNEFLPDPGVVLEDVLEILDDSLHLFRGCFVDHAENRVEADSVPRRIRLELHIREPAVGNGDQSPVEGSDSG